MVDGARHTKGLVVYEMHFEPRGARIGRSAGNFGFKIVLQLEGPRGFTRGREAFGGLASLAGGTWRGRVEPEIRTSCRHASVASLGKVQRELTGMMRAGRVIAWLHVVIRAN